MYITDNKNKTNMSHRDFFAVHYMVIHSLYLQNHKFGSILW